MNVLMIASGFELGGVTSAMRNLCNELVLRGHQVDILDLPGEGVLPEGFDRRIQMISLSGFTKNWNLSMTAVHNAVGFRKLWLLLLGVFKKATNKGTLWQKIVFRRLKFNKHYDILIGFRQSPVSYWLAKYKCNSNLAVGFWHTDADFENVSQLEDCLQYPDKVCCVSDAITQQMKRKYPQFSDKFTTVYNLFDVASIKLYADEQFSAYDSDVFNIVTVGRLSPSKKIETIPEICNQMRKKTSRKFKWYVVGEGPDRSLIEDEIKRTNTADCFELLGAKNNPYPYIKNADLFVLTSVWESFGMVIQESLICGTPVIAGDYPALHEILLDSREGIIAENSIAGIVQAVVSLINDADKYNEMKRYLSEYSYSSDTAYKQLINLCK